MAEPLGLSRARCIPIRNGLRGQLPTIDIAALAEILGTNEPEMLNEVLAQFVGAAGIRCRTSKRRCQAAIPTASRRPRMAQKVKRAAPLLLDSRTVRRAGAQSQG